MWVPLLLILSVIGIWLLPEVAAERRTWALAMSTLRSFFAPPCLTDREQILSRRLAVMYPEHLIFTHVALSQFVDLMPSRADQRPARCRSAQLVADFVLCRRDLSVVAVIELDARVSESPLGGEPQPRAPRAIESAGLRWVTIGRGPIPSQAELQAILQERRDPGVAVVPG
jgi:hypothetical protein